MCRGSYVILSIMKSGNFTNKAYGITLNEILSLEETSKISTIHKRVKELLDLELVCEGLKSGKAKSYYITRKGIAELDNLPNNNKKEVIKWRCVAVRI